MKYNNMVWLKFGKKDNCYTFWSRLALNKIDVGIGTRKALRNDYDIVKVMSEDSTTIYEGDINEDTILKSIDEYFGNGT